MSDTKIALIGLGEMNGAVLSSVISAGIPVSNISATTQSVASAEAGKEKYGITITALAENADANCHVATDADVLFLGVLPPEVTKVLTQVRDSLKPSAVVVSVAAGVTLEALGAALPEGQQIIRCLPNVPLRIGAGVVGMTVNNIVSKENADLVRGWFSAGGVVHEVDENQMDGLNAISGSGPGYLYYLAEAMQNAAEELGFGTSQASSLVAHTLDGAARILLEESQKSSNAATEMRSSMVLPGGTTAQAYSIFDKREVDQGIQAGVRGSATRSEEIAKELRLAIR